MQKEVWQEPDIPDITGDAFLFDIRSDGPGVKGILYTNTADSRIMFLSSGLSRLGGQGPVYFLVIFI